MKVIYLILLVIIFYVGFAYGQFKYILSHADLPEIKQLDRTVGQGEKLRYIAAGDSTSVGEGASDVSKSYTYRVADYLATAHEVEYRNVGVIGDQTKDVIAKQLSAIIDYNPDVITISIGANDVTHFVDNSKIIENYKTIIKDLTDKTHAVIYITDVPRFDKATLLPLPFRIYFDSQAKKANTELLKLETDRVKFVDIHKVEVSNSRDQFHPNDDGYTNWTNAFIERIK
jgi:lysophospholipase L1-like esterase